MTRACEILRFKDSLWPGKAGIMIDATFAACQVRRERGGSNMVLKSHDGRHIGMIAAVCAVTLGLVYMALAGAPQRLLLMNAAALAIGLVLLVIADKLRVPFKLPQYRGAVRVLPKVVTCIYFTTHFLKLVYFLGPVPSFMPCIRSIMKSTLMYRTFGSWVD